MDQTWGGLSCPKTWRCLPLGQVALPRPMNCLRSHAQLLGFFHEAQSLEAICLQMKEKQLFSFLFAVLSSLLALLSAMI